MVSSGTYSVIGGAIDVAPRTAHSCRASGSAVR
jgi:hypothetical protein